MFSGGLEIKSSFSNFAGKIKATASNISRPILYFCAFTLHFLLTGCQGGSAKAEVELHVHYHNHAAASGSKQEVERTTQAGGAVTSLQDIRTPPDLHAAVCFFLSDV